MAETKSSMEHKLAEKSSREHVLPLGVFIGNDLAPLGVRHMSLCVARSQRSLACMRGSYLIFTCCGKPFLSGWSVSLAASASLSMRCLSVTPAFERKRSVSKATSGRNADTEQTHKGRTNAGPHAKRSE